MAAGALSVFNAFIDLLRFKLEINSIIDAKLV
jgi:hypothetical protein